MSKNLFLFILFSFWSISFQLDCTEYEGQTCGDHNTKYNIQCHKFSSNNQCQEVEVDDGCKIDDKKKCVKTDPNSNNYACYFLGENSICRKISTDAGCKIEIVSSEPECKIDNVQETEDCSFDEVYKKCAKIKKACGNFSTDKCDKHGNTCFKVKINPFTTHCQIVTKDPKCDINTAGECITKSGATINAYEECAYNSGYDECKPRNLECFEMALDKCSECKTSPEGTQCSKVENTDTCLNVEVDSRCEINESGQCNIKKTNGNNKCFYNSTYTGCFYYEVSEKCQITKSGNYLLCSDNGLDDATKKCHFDVETGTKCLPVTRICSDYEDKDSCEAVELKRVNNKIMKCSWKNNMCQEFEIDGYCSVKNGECEQNEVDGFGHLNACFFDYDEKTCSRKINQCQSYYNNCDKHGSTDNLCFDKDDDSKYCKSVFIYKNCTASSYYTCTNTTIIDPKKKCAMEDNNSYKICRTIDKVCSDLNDDETLCKELGCAYIDNGCYEVYEDSDCKLNNGICQKASDAQFDEEKEKCDLTFQDTRRYYYYCQKRKLACSDYDSTKCNNAPNIENHKCYYLSNKCINVTLDENCKIDTEGKCVEDGSGKLSQYEKCALNKYDSFATCLKEEISCEDFTDDKCGNYSPEMKLCYNLGENGCKEVKVDDKCSINENNECKGDSCQFDENKDRCYYQKGESLKLSQIIFLMIFLML